MPNSQIRSQTYGNHARFDPPFHFFIIPILLLDLGFSIYVTIHHWPQHRALFLWWVVVAFTLIVLALRTRIYALKNQDRIIRLEERLRLASLLSPTELLRSNALTGRQLIALRFASDAELPTLVDKTLRENLQPKQIKQAITTWRPDDLRV